MEENKIKKKIEEWMIKQINKEKWIKNGRLTIEEFEKISEDLERIMTNLYRREEIEIKNIFGDKERLKIKNFVVLPQFNFPKLFVLQELEYPHHRREIRIGYYIVAKKGKKKGKWIWGQFNPHIPKEDLKKLIEEAKKERILC